MKTKMNFPNVKLPQGQQVKGTRLLLGEEADARRAVLDCLHR
jgi:hypothetical protein